MQDSTSCGHDSGLGLLCALWHGHYEKDGRTTPQAPISLVPLNRFGSGCPVSVIV